MHRTLDDPPPASASVNDLVRRELRECTPGVQWIRVETDDVMNGVRICVGRFEGIEASASGLNDLIHMSWAWSKWGIEPLWNDDTRQYRLDAKARCHRRLYVPLDDAVRVWRLPGPEATDNEADQLLADLPIKYWLFQTGITEAEAGRPRLTHEGVILESNVQIDSQTQRVATVQQCVAAASWVAWFHFEHPKMARAIVYRLLSPYFDRPSAAADCPPAIDCLRLKSDAPYSDLVTLGRDLAVWPPARSLDPFLHDDDSFKTLNGTFKDGGWQWVEFQPWHLPLAMNQMYLSRLHPTKRCRYHDMYWARHIDDTPGGPTLPVSRRPADDAWVRITTGKLGSTPARVFVGQWPRMGEPTFTQSVVHEVTGVRVGPRGHSHHRSTDPASV